ncbi:MAG: hypothetical protein ACMUIP_09230 [bacterium]
MMKIGARVSFEHMDDLTRNFKSVDFPFELALPWHYQNMWLPVQDRITEIIDFFKNNDFEILSLHATQGKITEESFLTWGRQTLSIAQNLEIRDITIHPNMIKSQRTRFQEQVLHYIKLLGGEDHFSIETFAGKNRIFTPRDLVERSLPITLDTAHIYDRQEVMDLIGRNHRNIRTIHLSAIGKGEHHLPIDDFCIKVAEQLKKINWSGNLILEYLPWHHYRLRDDITMLSNYLFNNARLELLPVSDQFRNDPERWGFNADGTN